MTQAPESGAITSTGFAGLAGLASDVDAVLVKAQAGRQPPAPPQAAAPAAGPASAPLTFADALEVHAEKARRRKWLAPGIGAACYVAAVVWVVVGGHHPQAYVPRAPARLPTAAASPYQPATAPLATAVPPLLSVPGQTFPGALPGEAVPAPGSGRLLNVQELQYCVAQKERIAGARDAVDHSVQTQVARFNALIQDFNSRCGEFRYHPPDKERITTLVESEKPQLRQQGVALLGGRG